MAYNKAREERKWKQWKEKEEAELRVLGMDEKAILELRESDWKEFKTERNYQRRRADCPEYSIWDGTDIPEPEITDVDGLLDIVSDERIFYILKDADRKTLQIIIFKMIGFSVSEIAEKMEIPEQTIYTRISRLKKKLKKFAKGE